ncbi:MAG: hypothetical protein Q4E03_05635 [Trueperella sp.]|nr:hypothetical protein [Trueperella sp.]
MKIAPSNTAGAVRLSPGRIDLDPPEAESGNMIVLGLGIWVFLLALLLVLGSALSVYNARKDLLAQADAIALTVASEISDIAYYSGETIYPGNVKAAATRALASQDWGDQKPELIEPTGSNGQVVVVSLRARAQIPFIPAFLSAADEVVFEVTSRARLRSLE